jgi:hypothetical protein
MPEWSKWSLSFINILDWPREYSETKIVFFKHFCVVKFVFGRKICLILMETALVSAVAALTAPTLP